MTDTNRLPAIEALGECLMYAPAYGLIAGYREMRGTVTGRIFRRTDNRWKNWYVGSDCFESPLEAKAAAAELRADRIASLEKTLAKLKKLPTLTPGPTVNAGEFAGMKVVVDPTLPAGDVSFRIAGKEVGRIVDAYLKDPKP